MFAGAGTAGAAKMILGVLGLVLAGNDYLYLGASTKMRLETRCFHFSASTSKCFHFGASTKMRLGVLEIFRLDILEVS